MSDHLDNDDNVEEPHDGSTTPELLGDVEPRPQSGRRWAAVAAASVAVVAAAGAGAWGVAQLMASGESPASAMPADTLAYLSLDLDPSAGQKIEALRILKKFPAISDELDIDVRGDLRRWVFEKAQEDGECTDVDYAVDIEPWLGDRVAVAAVAGHDSAVVPVVAVQVGDQDAARAGVEKLNACAEDDAAVAFVGEYLLLGEKQMDVNIIAADAKVASLQDDAGFAEWTAKAGDPGIITGYVSPAAPGAMLDAARAGSDDLGIGAEMKALDEAGALYEDFEGAALTVRFADGGVEAETATAGLATALGVAEGGLPSLLTLPVTTAAAVSVALPENWLSDFGDTMGQLMGGQMSAEDGWREIGKQTGLDLPQDVEALLGEGFTISVDASADLDRLVNAPEPTAVPIGVRITGDPAEITRVLDKLLALAGPAADVVLVLETADGVTIGLQQDYVDALVAGGGLGESDSFRSVVPDADRATTAVYLDFDAGDGWAERLADVISDGDPDLRANIAPLQAIGATSWSQDGVDHSLFRLSTD